jgi:hypothetical protein
MTINEIRNIELSKYPGMSKGYVTITSQVTDTKTGENRFDVVTVPAIEIGRRFEYNKTFITVNGDVTEEYFYMNNNLVASRILGKAKDFANLWHAPKQFDTTQIVVLDR